MPRCRTFTGQQNLHVKVWTSIWRALALKCIFKETSWCLSIAELIIHVFAEIIVSGSKLRFYEFYFSTSFIVIAVELRLLFGRGGWGTLSSLFSVEAVSCIIFRREYFSTLTYKCFIVIDSVASQDRKFLLIIILRVVITCSWCFTIMFKIFIMMLMQMICGWSLC